MEPQKKLILLLLISRWSTRHVEASGFVLHQMVLLLSSKWLAAHFFINATCSPLVQWAICNKPMNLVRDQVCFYQLWQSNKYMYHAMNPNFAVVLPTRLQSALYTLYLHLTVYTCITNCRIFTLIRFCTVNILYIKLLWSNLLIWCIDLLIH